MTPNPSQPPEEKKRKLLFLCQTLPFPPDGGVQIRSYNVLRQLAKVYEVTALCFYRTKTRGTPEAVQRGVEGLQSHTATAAAFPIPNEHTRARLVWDHFRSMVFQNVYTYYEYASKEYSDALKQLLRHARFDAVHLDSLDLSYYVGQLKGLPLICTHHNVESQLLESRARTENSAVRRRYLSLQGRLMRKEEAKRCRRFALNVMVSHEDEQLLRSVVPGVRTAVVPNGVDTSVFQPSSAATNGIVFVGGYGWYPNRDAMAYYAQEVHTLVKRSLPGVNATWVGRAPDSVLAEYADKYDIRLTGYVDDIRPHVLAASCYIAPLRAGGGTRLKILDAWAMGKAVVSTSVGCEGLAARDGENILIRDDPAGFAEAVVAVINDAPLRERLGRAARTTVERRYDWDVIGTAMIDAYSAALERRECSGGEWD